MANRARGVSSIFAEKNPVVDFVPLSLHPFKEPFETYELSFPMEQNLFLVLPKFFKRFLDWNSMSPAGLP
jgi:hypothetical protein